VAHLHDELGQTVVVPVGGTEPRLRRERAPQEEVEIVLPRVADATVDLRRVLPDPARCFTGCRLGHVRGAGYPTDLMRDGALVAGALVLALGATSLSAALGTWRPLIAF